MLKFMDPTGYSTLAPKPSRTQTKYKSSSRPPSVLTPFTAPVSQSAEDTAEDTRPVKERNPRLRLYDTRRREDRESGNSPLEQSTQQASVPIQEAIKKASSDSNAGTSDATPLPHILAPKSP